MSLNVRRSGGFEVSPETVAGDLGDEVVLVNLGTNRIHSLNSTAARLWELVCAGLDRNGIVQRLADEFDVSEEVLAREVDAMLASLRAESLIVEPNVD